MRVGGSTVWIFIVLLSIAVFDVWLIYERPIELTRVNGVYLGKFCYFEISENDFEYDVYGA